jgi:hypothetical protein
MKMVQTAKAGARRLIVRKSCSRHFSQKQNGEKDAQANSFIALEIMLISPKAGAQTVTNIAVLKGLGPLTILDHSEVGKAALGSNFTVTGGIQTGTIRPQ